jgi:hypothetical protein
VRLRHFLAKRTRRQTARNLRHPNNPQNLANKRCDREGEVPVWVKLAVDLGLKLD